MCSIITKFMPISDLCVLLTELSPYLCHASVYSIEGGKMRRLPMSMVQKADDSWGHMA